jgi:hypothetical protein
MIHHIVIFNFKPEVSSSEIEEHFRQEAKLHQLPYVEEVKHWKVVKTGNKRNREDLSYATLVSFKDETAAEAYRAHPVHREFREKWADRLTDQTNAIRCQFVDMSE